MRDGAGTVLLVDDEDLVRQSTADMLADLGYAVVEASSGPEALALVRAGRRPLLWAHEPEVAAEIERSHANSRYLPGIALPESIGATSEMA